jgi:hypothetical protein
MKKFLIFPLFFSPVSGAFANPCFLNPTQTQYKILVTLPNGEKSNDTIGKCSRNMAYVSPTTPDSVRRFNAELLDEMDATVWKGLVKNDMNYVIAPDSKGHVQLLQAGFYSGRSDVPAACVVNLTGDDLQKFDAVGQSGFDAKRGLKFATGFDPKQLVRWDPKESQYALRVTDNQGQVHDVETYLNSGFYYALIKDATGHYLVSSAGYLRER